MIQLKVLTLNCWGVFIPAVCKLKPERMVAISQELSKGEYDIVMLQEVWVQSDYEMLCERLMNTFPYTHYFHSGNFGSGLCVFSKYLIYDTAQYGFTLNGHPHRILFGDWFCKKSVGLCKIPVDGIKVYAYTTHLHAQYREPDDYEVHRVSQSFELAQFIRVTGESSDVIIVGGDFNYSPQQIGYDVITQYANLEDSWLARKNINSTGLSGEKGVSKSGHLVTANNPENSFYNRLDHNPTGQTLDFIFFRQQTGYQVSCESCDLVMWRVGGEAYSYSDHEGVGVVFNIVQDPSAERKTHDQSKTEEVLNLILPKIESGIKKVKSEKSFYFLMASILAALLLYIVYSEFLGFLPNILEFVFEGFLLLLAAFYFVMAIFWVDREWNGLLSVQKSIQIALKSSKIDN